MLGQMQFKARHKAHHGHSARDSTNPQPNARQLQGFNYRKVLNYRGTPIYGA